MQNITNDILKYTKNPAKRAVFLLFSVLTAIPSKSNTYGKDFDGVEPWKHFSDLLPVKAVEQYKKVTQKTIMSYRETLESLLNEARRTEMRSKKKGE